MSSSELQAEGGRQASATAIRQGELMHVFEEGGVLHCVSRATVRAACRMCSLPTDATVVSFGGCQHLVHLECLERSVWQGAESRALDPRCPWCVVSPSIVFDEEARSRELGLLRGGAQEQLAGVGGTAELDAFRALGLWDGEEAQAILRRPSRDPFVQDYNEKGGVYTRTSYRRVPAVLRTATKGDLERVRHLKARLLPSDYPRAVPLARLLEEAEVPLRWVCSAFRAQTIEQAVDHLGLDGPCLGVAGAGADAVAIFDLDITGLSAHIGPVRPRHLSGMGWRDALLLRVTAGRLLLMGLRKDMLRNFGRLSPESWVSVLGLRRLHMRLLGLQDSDFAYGRPLCEMQWLRSI